jgi:quercetin dioxygenase-like cupin family protein
MSIRIGKHPCDRSLLSRPEPILHARDIAVPSFDSSSAPLSKNLLVRHEESAPRERSTCGWRHLLVSRQDTDVAAWAHAVDIDGARPHYHKIATELYYVLEGEGTVLLDGKRESVKKGSLVHIPPGVVHGAEGRMRVLVVGIPDISDGDLYFPEAP